MVGRRGFLAGLLASGLAPVSTWADAGGPAFLSAARLPDGRFALCGISGTGTILFQIPIPGRGHAATAHPTRAEAVAFARRPGVFAIILECVSGTEIARLTCPDGRHFYGHGAYSGDGDLLFTSENDIEAGQGRIGVWDVRRGYARIGEFSSGGVGPHDMRLLPGTDVLVVANGGIETHPDSGRTKLNLATMRPNLSYLGLTGELLDQIELPKEMRRNSIRHLDVSADGQVAMGMQWQRGQASAPALVAVHRRGDQVTFLHAPLNVHRLAQGYIASIALSEAGHEVAVTCPRGGGVQVFDTRTEKLKDTHDITDASGIVGLAAGFVVTSGLGQVRVIGGADPQVTKHPLEWDNHLVRI